MRLAVGVRFDIRRSLNGIGTAGDVTPPELSNVNSVSLSINMDMSEPGTVYMLRNASPTLLTGVAVKAGAETSWSGLVEGTNNVVINDTPWADGTWYLHFAGEDAAGNITPTGAVVEWVKTTPFTVYSHVLNPAAATSGLRYSFTANTIATLATARSAGYWLGAYAYWNGTNWTGSALSIASSASTTGFLELGGNLSGWRATGGTERNPTALATPTVVGWYFLTTWCLTKATGSPDPKVILDFWRNGTKATGYTSTTTQDAGWDVMDRFGFGHTADSTPTDYNDFATCGLCYGTGDPSLMHDWVYNGGTLRDVRDYNFAGDANGCTLLSFWPAGRLSGATFDVNDTQLDDSIGSNDTPTLVGTMQWSAINAPIGD